MNWTDFKTCAISRKIDERLLNRRLPHSSIVDVACWTHCHSKHDAKKAQHLLFFNFQLNFGVSRTIVESIMLWKYKSTQSSQSRSDLGWRPAEIANEGCRTASATPARGSTEFRASSGRQAFPPTFWEIIPASYLRNFTRFSLFLEDCADEPLEIECWYQCSNSSGVDRSVHCTRTF